MGHAHLCVPAFGAPGWLHSTLGACLHAVAATCRKDLKPGMPRAPYLGMGCQVGGHARGQRRGQPGGV